MSDKKEETATEKLTAIAAGEGEKPAKVEAKPAEQEKPAKDKTEKTDKVAQSKKGKFRTIAEDYVKREASRVRSMDQRKAILDRLVYPKIESAAEVISIDHTLSRPSRCPTNNRSPGGDHAIASYCADCVRVMRWMPENMSGTHSN